MSAVTNLFEKHRMPTYPEIKRALADDRQQLQRDPEMRRECVAYIMARATTLTEEWMVEAWIEGREWAFIEWSQTLQST